MNGSDYAMSCPKCGAVNTLRGKAMTLALTCKVCNTYFRTGTWDKSMIEFQLTDEYQALPIGAKGKIEGYCYEVMGFVIKEETKYHYHWREYLLFNPYRGYAFLSEYDGHWNFIWPLETVPHTKTASSGDFYFEGNQYHLYQHYSAQVVYARGEFFFDVYDITASTTNDEYISPPYLLALEKNNDSVLWCQGEYFTPGEVAEIFSVDKGKLPGRKGIGYTQPFHTSFSDNALIRITVLLLIFVLALQLIINSSAEDKIIFKATYLQPDLKDQKMVATPSFELTGTKSLEVSLSAPLMNDWFFGEFALVNDADGTEYNFTKEIEYYTGYEDGSVWTEGSKNADAYLSQIPDGKYHINIYPEFSTTPEFSITVSRDVPMQSNFYVTVLALLIYPAFFFIRRRYREGQRWSDSEYTPYE